LKNENVILFSYHDIRSICIYFVVYVSLCVCEREKGKATELYRINRERHSFLGNAAENQQHFVAFAIPSCGQIWQIE
jgi:hypothetical protein